MDGFRMDLVVIGLSDKLDMRGVGTLEQPLGVMLPFT